MTSNEQSTGFTSAGTHAHYPAATTAEAATGQGSGVLEDDSSTGFGSHSTYAPQSAVTTAGGESAAGKDNSFLGSSSTFEPVSSPTRSLPQSEGFGGLTQEQQYPISTQASQGSIDTNAGAGVPYSSAGGQYGGQQFPFSTQASQGSIDINAGSGAPTSAGGQFGGQFGGQSGFDDISQTGSHTQSLSQDLPNSAAGFAEASSVESTFPSGGGASTGAFSAETAPVITAQPLSSARPSDNWGTPPAFAPEVHAEPAMYAVPAAAQPAVHAESAGYESQRSQPYSDAITAHDQTAIRGADEGQTQHDSFASGTDGVFGTEQQQGFDDSLNDRFQKLPDVPSFSDLPSERQGMQGTASQETIGQTPLSHEGFYQGSSEGSSQGQAFRPLHRQLSAQAESLLRQSSTLTGKHSSV